MDAWRNFPRSMPGYEALLARVATVAASVGCEQAVTELMLRWLPPEQGAGLGGVAFQRSQFEWAKFAQRLKCMNMGSLMVGVDKKDRAAMQAEVQRLRSVVSALKMELRNVKNASTPSSAASPASAALGTPGRRATGGGGGWGGGGPPQPGGPPQGRRRDSPSPTRGGRNRFGTPRPKSRRRASSSHHEGGQEATIVEPLEECVRFDEGAEDAKQRRAARVARQQRCSHAELEASLERECEREGEGSVLSARG